MADKWMDERDRRRRGRDWRQSEDLDRERGVAGEGYYPRGREERSFGGDDQETGARRSGPQRDRVFGERETGASYGGVRPGGGDYGAGGSYGTGEGYRGGYPERAAGDHAHGGDWQDRDYGGVSPAMGHGEYELDRGGPTPRFSRQDYTQGGRFYGDDERQRIYREEYGQGGREYGRVPRGYDAQRGGPSGGSYGGSYGGAGGDYGYRARPAYGGVGAGGTGGYDYDRGYGDGGRRDVGDRGDRWEQRARESGERVGDFFQRAGQRVRDWIRGDNLMDDDDRGYQTDFGRERRYFPEERGHRGLGPKGYKRSDERITDEVHERLTDDSWLDASAIAVAVKDGEVTLSGSVESREAKHRAERLVENLSGVTHVQNNLRVMSNPITGSGHGFGDSAAQVQARRDDPSANGSGGAAATKPGKGLADDKL